MPWPDYLSACGCAHDYCSERRRSIPATGPPAGTSRSLARSLIVVAGTIVCARRQGTVTPSVTDVCVRESSLACSWLCVAS